MLFVNSVEEISLVEVAGETGGDINKTGIKTLYSVKIYLSDEARGKRDKFQKYVQEMSSSLKTRWNWL